MTNKHRRKSINNYYVCVSESTQRLSQVYKLTLNNRQTEKPTPFKWPPLEYIFSTFVIANRGREFCTLHVYAANASHAQHGTAPPPPHHPHPHPNHPHPTKLSQCVTGVQTLTHDPFTRKGRLACTSQVGAGFHYPGPYHTVLALQ